VNSAARTIPFVKASACGNDFLLIDAAVTLWVIGAEDISAFTRRICDRHEGVGADGVEWMKPHASADVEISLINADGSAAEISGNGTRCVAAYVCNTQGKERISILTGAGEKICTLISRTDSDYEFEMEMGRATVEAGFTLTVPGWGWIGGTSVSMGNPHFVMMGKPIPEDWRLRAEAIQKQPQFPQGVNVEFVAVDGKHDIHAVFFERGAGETRSSGTGSCASAVAAMQAGEVQSPVKVHAPGGTQTVRQQDGNVFLRGSARIVCRGEFFVS
jgi:diaminopimelate epimerase